LKDVGLPGKNIGISAKWANLPAQKTQRRAWMANYLCQHASVLKTKK
jgi:hypothetical protein